MDKKVMKYCIFFMGMILFGCKTEKKYHDTEQTDTSVQYSDALQEIYEFQKKLNTTFKDPETSPLPDRYRKNFETLEFFPADTTYRIHAKFERTLDALPFSMPTTTGDTSEEVVYGIASFVLKGKTYELEIYQSPELSVQEGYVDYLFLPFLDNTNGTETYAGGRYIDLKIPEGDSILIDFNTAYNPYCAYNKKYSCPIVPTVNTLETEVLAGVRAFQK